jgi:hypothetical protein
MLDDVEAIAFLLAGPLLTDTGTLTGRQPSPHTELFMLDRMLKAFVQHWAASTNLSDRLQVLHLCTRGIRVWCEKQLRVLVRARGIVLPIKFKKQTHQ